MDVVYVVVDVVVHAVGVLDVVVVDFGVVWRMWFGVYGGGCGGYGCGGDETGCVGCGGG